MTAENQGPVYLTEADVSAALGLPEVYDALVATLARQAQGEATGIPKVAATLPSGGNLHSLGSSDAGSGLAGFKNWINTPRGAQAVYLLFDAREGKLLAVLQAGILGALRTAATAAVATEHLAAPSADTAAILGTGRQAIAQLAAVHLVRPLKSVRVWSPNPASRDAFAERAAGVLGVEATVHETATEAVAGAQIVTTVTRSAEPVLHVGDLDAGTHLNAMGAILPHALEVDPALLVTADVVVVDDVVNVMQQSGEVIAAVASDPTLPDRLVPLHQLTGARAPDLALTVLKSVGTGLSDLAAAAALYASVSRDGAADYLRLPTPPPGRLPRLTRG